ncbi:MAG: GT4 family glycosyltransferase PelF [Legionellales bacterium]|nr:GT4 family glycosyltransferase PelF [Legionellales bacterium]
MTKVTLPKSNDIDILLMLEGTYPLVAGGVSTWIYNLITYLPHYRFGAIFIGGREEDYHGLQYPLPSNLVHLEIHYLFPKFEEPVHHFIQHEMKDIHCPFKDTDVMDGLTDLSKIEALLLDKSSILQNDFWYSERSWDYLVKNYIDKCGNISFIDYFWTMRNIHAPLWRLFEIMRTAPKAKLIHSASTGYAGLLAALLSTLSGKKFILTEHGIYTKERRLDLLQKNWIKQSIIQELHLDYINEKWINLFEMLSRICYRQADPVISLFKAYQERQIEDGASPKKTRIIPNGVNIKKIESYRQERPASSKNIVALIGRVVKIKDIKTFIRAIAIAKQQLPALEGWIIGPEREDPAYARECRELVELLHLSKVVFFKGTKNLEDVLNPIDIIVLSSISEGQPLVVLEGFAAGIPCIVTDVGGCHELIYGKDEEDIKLGKAGEVVSISDPSALAKAIVRLLQNPKEYQAVVKVGKQRVQKYYDLKRIIAEYNQIYQEHI